MAASISLTRLANWCRAVALGLESGRPMVATLKGMQTRGPRPNRELSTRTLAGITSGSDFATALHESGFSLPPVLIALSKVGVETGKLPEVLVQLERYFLFQASMRRELLKKLLWPMFELGAAIGIIGLLIFLLGVISDSMGSEPLDVLGLGLVGVKGAAVWFAGWGAAFLLLAVSWWAVRKVFGLAGFVDRLLWRIPVLGPTLRELALSRLCFALGMTMDSAMSIRRAVPLSLESSGSAALAELVPQVRADLKDGHPLSFSFRESELFPDDFLEVLETGEESGQVPEQMARLGEEYRKRFEFQLAVLTSVLGWLVWFVVAGIVAVCIFRVFYIAYLKPMQDLLPR